jgi:hypothetical protein
MCLVYYECLEGAWPGWFACGANSEMEDSSFKKGGFVVSHLVFVDDLLQFGEDVRGADDLC